MGSELTVLSFICAALLSISFLFRRIRGDIASLSFVSWLIGCNTVHGVNAILWSGNVEKRAIVWCDIVTKLTLGTMIALPAACLCIMRRLERTASSRKIPLSQKSRRNWFFVDFLICYVVPLLYMLLHLCFQDHRFDIVEDYGCFASIYPSTVVSVLISLPPLICCIITFVLCGLVIHYSCRASAAQFSMHIETRSSMISRQFFRKLTAMLILSVVLFVINMFYMFTTLSSASNLSWSAIHANLRTIEILTTQEQQLGVKLMWWGIFALSIIYILVACALGQESREAIQYIRSHWSKQPKLVIPIIKTPLESLRLHRLASRSPSPHVTNKPQLTSLDLRSGWDEMLESKPAPLFSFFSPQRSKTPVTPSRSKPVSPAPSPISEDEAFLASTLSYLVSPTAHTLGLASPLTPLPPVYMQPRKVVTPPPAIKRPATPTPPSTPPMRPMSESLSVLSSVFDAYWPQPPTSSSDMSSRHSRCWSPPAPSTDSGHTNLGDEPIGSHQNLQMTTGYMTPTPSDSLGLQRRTGPGNSGDEWNPEKLVNRRHVIYETPVRETE
ncbi:hypothetical protein AMATHDRAFT_5419 [Amanita thiersii Skay4041]|uniref:G-protein coupled receptors family 1 profile domain-containing protein n=1 Tax=Amanita thiersii Skay4041 TaxID=703135 RepID=A0A2A9NM52_9AGAR|nr:hypothetical protein AMATHDRAFT_5419 [Amanita thiersii Skay4041]